MENSTLRDALYNTLDQMVLGFQNSNACKERLVTDELESDEDLVVFRSIN